MNDEKEKSFKPFIAADLLLPELTVTSIISGIILAVVFGAVNAYLGLKVGMTISASIPAAVVSMSITRYLMKRDSILENNIVQTIGSAGESLAAGAIFTIPAMFLWARGAGVKLPSMKYITLVSIIGGLLGVLFMIPLRKALIVKEHGHLPYPEGSACADVLLAGEEGGEKAKATFLGMGFGAFYKILTDGFKLFPSRLEYVFKKPFHVTIGGDFLPAILGVGFIIGRRISGLMLAGSILGWIIIIPVIVEFGGGLTVFPADVSIASLDNVGIWNYYIRYIGAGAVAFGGLLALLKSIPLIYNSIIEIIKDYNEMIKDNSMLRTDRDLPLSTVILGILFIWFLMSTIPMIRLGFVGAIIVIIFGYFFATVSSRIVGLIGSSSNPISGMTMATLLITGLIYKQIGPISSDVIISVFTVGSIICIIIAMAGDTSQDLKTGFLVGATPYKQQIGEIIGVLVTGVSLSGVLFLLDSAWGFGTAQLPAPQATLIKLVVKGVMEGQLPWTLIFIGIGVGLMVEVLNLPILPIAIGLYLPIHLTSVIFIGGVIRGLLGKELFNFDSYEKKVKIDSGVLFSAGLIAGEGIIGIILALFSVLNISIVIGLNLGWIATIIFFMILLYMMLKWSIFKNVEH
ncbi:MAG: oligopeptide transporter, OPT family [Firmicutes bacterium]|nr:oligopeptide transporter, OPT family [Bacillota bacterium]